MRVLGIDPGLRVTGYGCIDPGPRLVEAGLVRLVPARSAPLPSVADRLVELDADLAQLLRRLQPDAVAVESLFAHWRHPATAAALGHARGVILLRARHASLTLLELPPKEVKRAVCGYGQAPKEQIQRAVQTHLGLDQPPRPADVADALAIALCAAARLNAANPVAADHTAPHARPRPVPQSAGRPARPPRRPE